VAVGLAVGLPLADGAAERDGDADGEEDGRVLALGLRAGVELLDGVAAGPVLPELPLDCPVLVLVLVTAGGRTQMYRKNTPTNRPASTRVEVRGRQVTGSLPSARRYRVRRRR
jgi:hypothetical protein